MPREIDRYFYLHDLQDEENPDDFDSEDWEEKIGPTIRDEQEAEAHQRYLEAQGDYTADWWDISLSYRESRKFLCENCSANFVDHKRLLHVHHMDHDRANNHLSNLMALCVLCHADCHPHMQASISENDRLTIIGLRNAAGQLVTRKRK
jgi:hypothetical protein